MLGYLANRQLWYHMPLVKFRVRCKMLLMNRWWGDASLQGIRLNYCLLLNVLLWWLNFFELHLSRSFTNWSGLVPRHFVENQMFNERRVQVLLLDSQLLQFMLFHALIITLWLFWSSFTALWFNLELGRSSWRRWLSGAMLSLIKQSVILECPDSFHFLLCPVRISVSRWRTSYLLKMFLIRLNRQPPFFHFCEAFKHCFFIVCGWTIHLMVHRLSKFSDP